MKLNYFNQSSGSDDSEKKAIGLGMALVFVLFILDWLLVWPI